MNATRRCCPIIPSIRISTNEQLIFVMRRRISAQASEHSAYKQKNPPKQLTQASVQAMLKNLSEMDLKSTQIAVVLAPKSEAECLKILTMVQDILQFHSKLNQPILEKLYMKFAPFFDSGCFQSILNHYSSAQSYDQKQIITWYKRLLFSKHEFKASISHMMIPIYAKSGDMRSIELLFKSKPTHFNDECIYATFIALKEQGDYKKMKFWYTKFRLSKEVIIMMLEISYLLWRYDDYIFYLNELKLHGYQPGINEYGCIISLCDKLGKRGEVKLLLLEITRKKLGINSHICETLIKMYTRRGMILYAINVLEKLAEINAPLQQCLLAKGVTSNNLGLVPDDALGPEIFAVSDTVRNKYDIIPQTCDSDVLRTVINCLANGYSDLNEFDNAKVFREIFKELNLAPDVFSLIGQIKNLGIQKDRARLVHFIENGIGVCQRKHEQRGLLLIFAANSLANCSPGTTDMHLLRPLIVRRMQIRENLALMHIYMMASEQEKFWNEWRKIMGRVTYSKETADETEEFLLNFVLNIGLGMVFDFSETLVQNSTGKEKRFALIQKDLFAIIYNDHILDGFVWDKLLRFCAVHDAVHVFLRLLSDYLAVESTRFRERKVHHASSCAHRPATYFEMICDSLNPDITKNGYYIEKDPLLLFNFSKVHVSLKRPDYKSLALTYLCILDRYMIRCKSIYNRTEFQVHPKMVKTVVAVRNRMVRLGVSIPLNPQGLKFIQHIPMGDSN